MNKKIRRICLMSLLAVLLLAGCGNKEKKNNPNYNSNYNAPYGSNDPYNDDYNSYNDYGGYDYNDYSKYFYKTDHHWNHVGSYEGYKEIISMILPFPSSPHWAPTTTNVLLIVFNIFSPTLRTSDSGAGIGIILRLQK